MMRGITGRVIASDDASVQSTSDAGSLAFSSDVGSDAIGNGEQQGADGIMNKAEIAKAETKAVRSLKLLVLLVLVLSAVGVALAVYFYTSTSEQTKFESGYSSDAQKVLEGIGRSLENTMAALDTFQVSIVSNARASGQQWPFVTMPNFGLRASKVRLQSQGYLLVMHPLVTRAQRSEWETYSMEHAGWVNESMRLQETDEFYYGPIWYNHSMADEVYTDDEDVGEVYDPPIMLPEWQMAPIVTRWPAFNWDLLSMTHAQPVERTLSTGRAVFGGIIGLPDPSNPDDVRETENWKDWLKDYVKPGEDPSEPSSDLYYPILDEVDHLRVDKDPSPRSIKGLLCLSFFWRDMLTDLLPRGSNGIDVVISNPCTTSFTYRLNGPNTTFLGRGDLHELPFDHYGMNSSMYQLDQYFIRQSTYTGASFDDEYCPYSVAVFPSSVTVSTYTTANPVIFTICSVLIFAFTSIVFILYDKSVERRQTKVMKTAVRAETIVQSLFPDVVRDRIYPTTDESSSHGKDKKTVFKLANSKTRLQSYLNEGNHSSSGLDEPDINRTAKLTSAPIADLFPDCTVMFADVVGFTAWSSIREPTQVFTLLETLYGAFDAIARRRGVFKVETIGDSYVAVCGLPTPRVDHAVVMARFARDCRESMSKLTRQLETSLGPDTGNLKLRFGLNSGPVTAGVLRGERSRFQLFGDTVNCAARMESNGKPNMIQCSQKTADLLLDAGKGSWIAKRDEMIEAKGKGALQTYWVEPPTRGGNSSESNHPTSDIDVHHIMGRSYSHVIDFEMVERLIDWHVDSFTLLIKRIVARRSTMGGTKPSPHGAFDATSALAKDMTIEPRSEITEVITLPKFDFKLKGTVPKNDLADVFLTSKVRFQLHDYISTIAYTYGDNAFHNFEHASHVTFSTMKLLQRVVSPEVSLMSGAKSDKKVAEELASNLHSSTYGITSDPLTQFAIVFAALIHDVDHPGVSNSQLVTESDPIALLYKGKSPAEQNSVCIAWDLLMRPTYQALRACLFESESDLKRFRQLVVNSVMATDIFDKELKAFREARWSKAFASASDEESSPDTSNGTEESNRKATIVIEHLIQASDVAHTMQHWMVYQKWNKRLFQEMYVAYRSGRSASNPADGWYKGELWFFDNYIIPLARKLKECRVFGVSCDEFLDYAADNRSEWEAKGEAIVAELVQEMESMQSAKESMSQVPSFQRLSV